MTLDTARNVATLIKQHEEATELETHLSTCDGISLTYGGDRTLPYSVTPGTPGALILAAAMAQIANEIQRLESLIQAL